VKAPSDTLFRYFNMFHLAPSPLSGLTIFHLQSSFWDCLYKEFFFSLTLNIKDLTVLFWHEVGPPRCCSVRVWPLPDLAISRLISPLTEEPSPPPSPPFPRGYCPQEGFAPIRFTWPGFCWNSGLTGLERIFFLFQFSFFFCLASGSPSPHALLLSKNKFIVSQYFSKWVAQECPRGNFLWPSMLDVSCKNNL
jgi:hypothetical protein